MKLTMKTLRPVAAALLLALTACSDDDSNNVNGNATAVANNMKSGTWRITSFTEDGTDETNHFTGYNFTFAESGTLTATNTTNTYTGVWSVTDSDDDSNDDNPSGDDIHFNIAFSTPVDFTELTDDWHVYERTGIKIVLIDESGGNGGTDYLTFEKN
ncbi:hypothetical protein ACLI1A_16630 [Flavobacterium sp. RHBU_3]|uniref:hypothetical protein n=1 Tax=Flavobacterium sp. RHBU_3 TaxID=3391184 RepID=UPI0039849D18